MLDIKPLPRGSGFSFEEKITGGVVPRNYIPSVEEGVIDGLKHGPLGFPVVDVAVSLTTAPTTRSTRPTWHSASRAASASSRRCRNAARCCSSRSIRSRSSVRSEATAKINAILSGRRGQILSFDTREGWEGWDVVRAMMPESEIGDLIIEVRSATAGVGSFTFKFDHMAELTGKPADQIVAARRAAAAE